MKHPPAEPSPHVWVPPKVPDKMGFDEVSAAPQLRLPVLPGGIWGIPPFSSSFWGSSFLSLQDFGGFPSPFWILGGSPPSLLALGPVSFPPSSGFWGGVFFLFSDFGVFSFLFRFS